MQCGKAHVLVGSQGQVSGEKIVEHKDGVWWTRERELRVEGRRVKS